MSDSLTLDQLPALRERTEKAASRIHARLTAHLDTLQMLFSPKRVLGRYVQTTDGIQGPRGEKAHTQLKERFASLCGAPYGLNPSLGEEPLQLGRQIALYPWRYDYTIESHAITLTSPLRWLMAYESPYTPDQLEKTLRTGVDRRPADITQFLTSAIALAILLDTFPGLTALLRELGYDITTQPSEALGPVPVVSIESRIPSFRPADELILMATRFSGVPAFIELISDEHLRGIEADAG